MNNYTFLLALSMAIFPSQWFLNAHNSYPAEGRGVERLAHARQAGLTVFEIDVAWSPELSHTYVSHRNTAKGDETTLKTYFFDAFSDRFADVLLLIDFKGDQAPMVREIYDLVRSKRPLLTTFTPERINWGPLTVLLTGNLSAIEQFRALMPVSEPYFAIGNRQPLDNKPLASAADYFREPADNFFRVYNFDWVHVEGAKNSDAGSFTATERSRLRALVNAGHKKGYWLRFWTLNGTSREWSPSENFGSRRAVEERWRAAKEAGVEMIATDEYEWAGEFLRKK
jgi:hypothetical protein